VLREELNDEYRGVIIDDRSSTRRSASTCWPSTPNWPTGSSTTTADRGMPLFERYFVHEQLHRALDRKVFLPSGGSLIIERTEASP
jgi:ribonuclease E